MQVIKTIGPVIIPKRLRVDHYELAVRGMCGDANHYNETSTFFDACSVEAMKKLDIALSLLREYGKIDSGYTHEKKYLIPMYDKVCAEHAVSRGEMEDLLGDLVGSDSTTDGQYRAALDKYAVFYVSAQGVRHTVDITFSQ